MAVSISRLRFWFVTAIILLAVTVAGFYLYARYRVIGQVAKLANKLDIQIQQTTQGFSLSKSEGGRTIFTIRASRATAFKGSGRAELEDVNIVVRGRNSDRFDQIYGKKFEYDQHSGTVLAKGEVQIDLQGAVLDSENSGHAPPQEMRNPIHLKTAGLVFNRNTGEANTNQELEFRVPQASGRARGASYDSKTNALTLHQDVIIVTKEPDAATITARHGVITKEPRRIVLDDVRLERADETFETARLTVFLRDDNSVDHALAQGAVKADSKGDSPLSVRAPQAELSVNAKNAIQNAVFTGGVDIASTGEHPINATAQRVTVDFNSRNQVRVVHATEAVRIVQQPTPGATNAQPFEMRAEAMDFFVRNGTTLDRAETLGPAQIITTTNSQNGAPTKTTASAEKFIATFNKQGRITTLHGAPGAKVVASAPGEPDRITTSRDLDLTFDRNGGINSLVQQGEFRYQEQTKDGSRDAWADKASYSPATEMLILAGSPRIVDGGMTITAETIRLNRRTGDAEAQTNVKTTYNQLKPNPQGAMLASGDPVHVTARTAFAQRSTAVARYSGEARLWQGANIVQAPTITFDQKKRTVVAQGDSKTPVSTVLVQPDKRGKITPVSIRAPRLTYDDSGNTARFEGGVILRGAEGTMTSSTLTAYLARQTDVQSKNPHESIGPSRIERIVAEKDIVLQEPTRRATGQKLVFTVAEGKFVMTGGPPTVTDSERGTVTGASLTFWNRNDRVLVEGGESRAVTTTRVSK